MVGDESYGEGFADDIFNEFENSLKYFESLRKLLDDIDDKRVEGDYRFRRVNEDGFDGFDVRVRMRIPLVKSLRLKRAGKRQRNIYIETIEDEDELIIVGLVPAVDLKEVDVETAKDYLLLSTRSGSRKLIPVKDVDLSRKPKIKLRNGILEIRLRKLK